MFALVECYFIRWRTEDGRYTVEVITLTSTSRHRDGTGSGSASRGFSRLMCVL
jgi:hypothetical protein